MRKEIVIEGMSCGHCSGRVEKALNGLDHVTVVEVNLETKKAVVDLSEDVSVDLLTETVEDAGYDVVSVQ